MNFSAVRNWKTTIHCVVWILSVFFGLFILLMPTEARDYHIRASDGEVYTVTLGETPDINNFSVRKSNGEMLRGVTEAERATTAELYLAAELFWHILPLYSLDAPVKDLDAWVTGIATKAIIKLLVQQGADILLDGAVNGFLGTVQRLLGGNPVEIVEGWIPAAINDAVKKDAEQRLLIDAANLAKSFAATVVTHENMLRDFYLSYETRSVIISIDEINTAWHSFYVALQCKSLTTNLVHEYLQDPESEINLEPGSLGNIAISLLPAGKKTTKIAERVVTITDFIGDVIDVIETIDSVNYAQEHIEKLQHVRESAGSWIHQQVLSDINQKKRELRGTLDQVGYFQPTIAAPLEDIRLFDNDPQRRLDVRDYFSPNSGESITYIGRSNDLSVAVAQAERSGSSVIIITPKGVGTTSVIVELINLRGLRVTQSFSVTVNVPPPDEPSPEPVGTIPNENETKVPPLLNHRPEGYRQIEPQNFRVGDAPKWRNLSSYFSDPDGDILIYKANSSNDHIVVATIEGNSLKTTPEAPGNAEITVTAEDPGGLIEEQSFRVTVQARLQTIPSLPVCDRTPQVREEIMKRTRDNNCANVTEDELESIKRLSMLEEDITTLKQGDFDELRGLEELVLKGNFLETLPKDVFWYLGNLKELSLRNNQFTILVEDTFEHLDSLTYLSLRGNQLTTLQQGAFNDLDSLIELDLSDNQLTALPAGVFEELFNLKELTLENNHITILSRDVFLGLSSLEDLELDGNSLHRIEAGAFNGLSSLTDLDFNNYPLQTIEAGAFNGLNNLTDLELGNTQLTTLLRDVFLGLSSLEHLYLDENPLQTIEAGAFNGLNNLTYLNLDDTELQTIEVGAFNELSSLTDLHLTHAKLSTLQQGVFSGLSSLENLDLDENALRAIEVGTFNGLSNLISLDLDENQLATLPVGIFRGLSRLERLDLRSNPGAPFSLTLELARTDNTNLEAAGPATVKVTLAEGAPFDMNIRLSIEGGTLSADIATLTRGQTESDPITIKQNGTRIATVRLEIAPTIPQGYRGIQMAVGTPLVLFYDQDTSLEVSIPDENLRAIVRTALELAEGDTLTQQEMQRLTVLRASNSEIKDLTGLEHATHLTKLSLTGTNHFDNITPLASLTALTNLHFSISRVSDLSPLAGLTALTRLDIRYSPISDLSPLADLTALTNLYFESTNISDLSPLSDLTALTSLTLDKGQVSDISPLRGLTALTNLNFYSNQISDISPLRGLTALTNLNFRSNQVSDINPLRGLTALRSLSLRENQITDISALVSVLRDLTALRSLNLRENQITDISMLRDLTALTNLNLRENQITDVTPLANLTSLIYLSLEGNPIVDFAPLRKLKEKNPKVFIDIDINVDPNNAPAAPAAPVLPAQTVLLSNYPNPFNPETWIPYQLAEPADVTVSIYSVNGKLIRRLTLGHQPVGIYTSRNRAAYWDGRNALGEPVASGLYFYTLTAGDFTATRKMLIKK